MPLRMTTDGLIKPVDQAGIKLSPTELVIIEDFIEE
jgi:hypothetical protein